MPTLVRLVEVDEVRIAALRPAPGGLVDLAGEGGKRRRNGELLGKEVRRLVVPVAAGRGDPGVGQPVEGDVVEHRSEEHTSELQSQSNLVCRLLLEKKK